MLSTYSSETYFSGDTSKSKNAITNEQTIRRQRNVLSINRLRSLIRSSFSSVSESKLRSLIHKDYHSILQMIPLDNVAAPIISEDDGIQEVLQNGLLLNGMDFSPCAKYKQFQTTVNMTRMLIQRLCDETNYFYKSNLNSKDMFRDIIVRLSRSAGAIEAKHVLSSLLLKNNRNMELQVSSIHDAKECRVTGSKKSKYLTSKSRLDIFTGEGLIHCIFEMVFLCEMKHVGDKSILMRHQRRTQSFSIDDQESRDEQNESSPSIESEKVLDFYAIMRERLSFSSGCMESVRYMNVEFVKA